MIADKTVPASELYAPVADRKAPGAANPRHCESSPEEVGQAPDCISAQQRRTFAGKTEFESLQSFNAALAEAKQALPQVKSAYKPSGRTTVLAALLMIGATPIVLVLLLGICGGLCFGWGALRSNFSTTDVSVGMSRTFGLLSIGLDLLLVILMVLVPMACYGWLSKAFKNRNPILPAVLAGAIDLLVAVALFVPIWKGETLAPTHLTFMLIPIRWVLIVIGGAIVPFLGAAVVAGKVSEQKFCERCGLYLCRYAEVQIPFDYAENALALLRGGNYALAGRLPRSTDKSNARIALWWAPGAATAFLELEVCFGGKYRAGRSSKDTRKTIQWLAFSIQCEGPQAEEVSRNWSVVS